jgi:hypothetical protein
MRHILLFFFFFTGLSAFAQQIDLFSPALQPVHVKTETVTYRGRKALKLNGAEGPLKEGGIAIIPGLQMQNGTIEVDLAGNLQTGADTSNRGFTGIAFHVENGNPQRYECFYLRPTNGRSDNQLQRNHSLQYVAEPDFPWQKLRREAPGWYESYADMEAGVWTHVKITVQGRKAQLYVNGASQPALVVNDLKHDAITGGIALWIGIGTEAHFSNLVVRKE